MTPDILKKWNNEQNLWGRRGPRGSAPTQTGTEKENQDRAGDTRHSGAPDSARPGPPGQSPVTVSRETSDSQHRPVSEGIRSLSDSVCKLKNGRTSVLGHASDDTCSEKSRDTCRVRSTACGDSVTVVCGESDIKAESREMTSDTAVVSGGESDAKVGGFKRNSFLRRSDSYRRAKNVLSPDLSKHNRKSVEVVSSLNNNSSVISRNDPSHLNLKSPPKFSGENESPVVAASPTGSQKPAQNGHQQLTSARTEKQGTKGNFFRSLRSSLSFSSLRVKKSQPRPAIHISSPLEASRVSSDYQVNVRCFISLLASFTNNSLTSSAPRLQSITHRAQHYFDF